VFRVWGCFQLVDEMEKEQEEEEEEGEDEEGRTTWTRCIM
jgi:hypothetical protein